MKVAKPGSVDHHAGPFILIYIRFLNLCQVFYTFSLCSSHAMLRVVLVMSCPYGSAGTSLRINKYKRQCILQMYGFCSDSIEEILLAIPFFEISIWTYISCLLRFL